MSTDNQMEIRFVSKPENEALARMVISAFVMQANPVMSVITEIRTAISEAVTNTVVHAYEGREGLIILRATLSDGELATEVEDFGCGIEDVSAAMQPFYTSKPDQERTGIGFALMQSFMDRVEVQSIKGSGTLVRMKKKLESGA